MHPHRPGTTAGWGHKMTIMASAVYDRMVKALAEIEPSMWAGSAEDQIKLILCEVADIVPARLFDDDVIGDHSQESTCT